MKTASAGPANNPKSPQHSTFLLPVYQAAGDDYAVPWQVLAAINEIETDYGRNLSTSSVGAVGWMQFLPSTWAAYGVDADGRGSANPYDPIDAIFAAARYLHAAGAERNLTGAIFAYNHATWYVNSVVLRATLLRLMPQPLVDGLTGLMQASFPIAGHLGPAATQPPVPVRLARQPAVTLSAPAGAPVIAVGDGHVVEIGHNRALGRFVTIEDSYGNRFTYARLGALEQVYPVLKPRVQSAARVARELQVQSAGAAGAAGKRLAAATYLPASQRAVSTASAPARTRVSTPSSPAAARAGARVPGSKRVRATGDAGAANEVPQLPQPPALAKERLFANPLRPASYAAGGWLQLQASIRSYAIATGLQISSRGPSDYFSEPLALRPAGFTLAALRPGATVLAGTVLAHVARARGRASGIVVMVRPAGAASPVDPGAIVAGWELLGRLTAGRTALVGAGESGAYGTGNLSLGQLLLASKPALERAVLSDHRVSLVPCARGDVQAGRVDRRVLAVIEYLSYSGFEPGISGLLCGEPTGSGAQLGDDVQISELDGAPIAGQQTDGAVANLAVRALLRLQGALRTERIVSRRDYPWQSVTIANPAAGGLEIDFSAPAPPGSSAATSALDGAEWRRLIRHLTQLDAQPGEPSPFAIQGTGGG